MYENFEKAVKDCIIPILSRFANGITDLKFEVNKSFNGTEYYTVETNNIHMTPCVFKTLCIQGEGQKCNDYDGEERICWRLHWRWTCFSGGSNGTELVSITTDSKLVYGHLNVFDIIF